MIGVDAEFSRLSMMVMTGTQPRMFRDLVEQYVLKAPGLTILVADSGQPAIQEHNAAAAARFPAAVRYHPFASQTPWRERLHCLLEVCETPYAVLAADDDVFVPDGLRESVCFLEAHRDHAGCHGYYYDVSQSQPGKLDLLVSGGFTGRGYDSPDPVGRLMALLYWYQSIGKSVQRRDDLRRAEVPADVSSGAMTELFMASATVIAGKVARLRVPYCIPNAGPDSTKPVDLCEGIMLGGEHFLKEYVPLRDRLAALLTSGYGTERDWKRLINIAFASHVRKNWRTQAMWLQLADSDDLPLEDVAALTSPGLESEQWPLPVEYLGQFIAPLLATGWPAFG